jgi:hypothetical protein
MMSRCVTFVNFTRLHGAATQKTALLISRKRLGLINLMGCLCHDLMCGIAVREEKQDVHAAFGWEIFA